MIAMSVSLQVQGELGKGTVSVSVFLMNRRRKAPGNQGDEDTLFAFPAEIEVTSSVPLPSRPMVRSIRSDDWDDDIAELHETDTPEYAAVHGISADWDVVNSECRGVRTAWIGRAAVEVTVTANIAVVCRQDTRTDPRAAALAPGLHRMRSRTPAA